MPDAFGRMAIGGTDEVEDPGVETFDGEAAEAGLDTILGASWLAAAVTDNVLNDVASAFPEFIAEPGVSATAAAMPVSSRQPWFKVSEVRGPQICPNPSVSGAVPCRKMDKGESTLDFSSNAKRDARESPGLSRFARMMVFEK